MTTSFISLQCKHNRFHQLIRPFFPCIHSR
nr:MAG TPA: hypothetical protein [Caudoviricetes sp.]